MVNINSLARDRLRQVEFRPCYMMDNRPNETLIPDRSQAGSTMTAPTAYHWGVDDKYAAGGTKIKKIRGTENVSTETWNVRILRPAGMVGELTHEMDRYHWSILDLSEMRQKKFGEMSSDDRHKVYFI